MGETSDGEYRVYLMNTKVLSRSDESLYFIPKTSITLYV